jgi:hypothetical protein
MAEHNAVPAWFDDAGAYDAAAVFAMLDRDGDQRAAVAAWFARGCLSTAEDFMSAATVFQTGTAPEHKLQTFLFASRAHELGHPDAVRTMVSALDNYLVSIGHKQLFGSDVITRGTTGCTCLYAVEQSVPDFVRASFGVEPLNTLIDQTALKNGGRNECPTICDDALAPTPKGSVPGIW